MAKTLSKLLLVLFTTLLFFSFTLVSARSNGFSNILSPVKLGLKKEKLSHLHFYFHEIAGGPNPTAIRVASAPTTNKSETFFGALLVADNPLTAAPERNSKLVGKAQGIYASASQQETALLMVLNFVFMEGKYNGSSVSLLGRNAIFSNVREMPIVGGGGLFRFSRGYAQAKTHTNLDSKTGEVIVEYNVYVFHY